MQPVMLWFYFKQRCLSYLSLLLLLLVYSLTVQANEVDNRTVLRVCFESQNNLPFILGNTTNGAVEFGIQGALPDLLILAAEKHNLALDFVSLPWRRCIQQLKQGKADALFAAVWTTERDAWGVFPKKSNNINQELALWFGDYRIYTRIHSDLRWNGEFFSGLNNGIGAPFGYIVYQKLAEMKATPKRNINANEGFSLVAKGRLDGYVIEETIGDRYIKEHKLAGEVVMLETSFMKVHWYIPVSHQWYGKNEQLARDFWTTLAKIRKAKGDKLLESYLD